MNAAATLAGFMKKHVLGYYYESSLATLALASGLERTPRGKTPLIVHRPPVHDALRRHGVEPRFTR
jgi:hypothetical protein